MPLQLVVTLKDRMVLRRTLDVDTVRVGRAPNVEVQLESMAISREHCVLRRDAARGTWTVEDLGSSNGTFLNGARIARAEVRAGDALQVGPFAISIRAEAQRADGSGVSSPELLELASALKAHLEPAEGAAIVLERDLFQIGADPSLDLFVRGPRKQALIVRGQGGFQLVNVGPDPAAVRLDGAPVADRAWLRDDVAITIGELALRFHLGKPDGGSEQTIQMNIADLGDLRKKP